MKAGVKDTGYTGNNKAMISGTMKFVENGINNIKHSENDTQTPTENIEIDKNSNDQNQIIFSAAKHC